MTWPSLAAVLLLTALLAGPWPAAAQGQAGNPTSPGASPAGPPGETSSPSASPPPPPTEPSAGGGSSSSNAQPGQQQQSAPGGPGSDSDSTPPPDTQQQSDDDSPSSPAPPSPNPPPPPPPPSPAPSEDPAAPTLVAVSTPGQLQRQVNSRPADLSQPVVITIQEHMDLRELPAAQDAVFQELFDPVMRNVTIRVRGTPPDALDLCH